MSFTIDVSTFVSMVKLVGTFDTKRLHKGDADAIVLTLDGGAVIVERRNPYAFIQAVASVDSASSMSVTLDPQLLTRNLVALRGQGVCTVALDDKKLRIKTGRSSFSINVSAAVVIGELSPSDEAVPLVMTRTEFDDMAKMKSCLVDESSPDTNRIGLAAYLLHPGRVIATDTFVVKSMAIESWTEGFGRIAPQIVELLSKTANNKTVTIEVGESMTATSFTQEGVWCSARYSLPELAKPELLGMVMSQVAKWEQNPDIQEGSFDAVELKEAIAAILVN